MKLNSFYINLLTFLIMVVSFQVSLPDGDFYTSQDDTVKSVPILEFNPIRVDSKKSDKQIFKLPSEVVSYFISTAIESGYSESIHYIQVYNLTREKEYFLLI